MTLAVERLDSAISDRLGDVSGGALSVCYQCGSCTAVCPMGVPARALIRGAQLGLKDDVIDERGLWYCATCKLCELGCPRGVKITDIIHACRVLAFEGRKAPERLEKALWATYEDGNPWGGKRNERAKWAEGMDIKIGKPAKHLLYVDDGPSYDPRLQKVARSVATVLKAAEIDFAILGEQENSSGDLVFDIGEEGFLEELAQKNIAAFKKSGAESIITVSPHSFSMFSDVYPRYGEMPHVQHYTQFLAGLADGGALKFGDGGNELTVTYHDPCYLGRYHGVYEEPRKLLENVPGLKLEEMTDSRQNALCCGGGGGLMWTEFEGERPSLRRVDEASETGASALVTSCPYCIQNFEDGVKTRGLSLKVGDISEILVASMKLDGGA